MKYYHASPTPGITVLEPRVSNHGKPLVYVSDKRENVLVYLSNAVEKFCREKGIDAEGSYQKWGSYGFDREGLLCLEEYWPNATEETYAGASGCIYTVECDEGLAPLPDVPHAYVAEIPLRVSGCEMVPDALEALQKAQREGKLTLRSYEENSRAMLDWIRKSTRQEYEDENSPGYYREFLLAKFPYLAEK